MLIHTGRSYAQQSERDISYQLTYISWFKYLSAIRDSPFAKKPQDGEASRLLLVLLVLLPIIEKSLVKGNSVLKSMNKKQGPCKRFPCGDTKKILNFLL